VQLNPNGTLLAAIPFNLSVMDLSFTLVYILNRLDVSEFAYRCILVVVFSVLRKILFFSKAAGILSGLVLQSCYSFSAGLPLMFHIIKVATLFVLQFIAFACNCFTSCGLFKYRK